MSKRFSHLTAAARCLLQTVPVHRLMRPLYGGIGTIFVLHRVRPPSTEPRLPGNARLEVSPAFLASLVDFVVASGFDVVSLDEAQARLAGKSAARRFVCFTFDDGYADNYEYAYPVFRERGLPFAVYVASGYVSRTSMLWHCMLERLLLRHDELRYELDGIPQVERAATMAEKEALYERLCDIVMGLPAARWPALFDSLFDDTGIRADQFHSEVMDWDQVMALSRDPLVTIGAHTVNHYNLALLEESQAHWEIAESKRIIEQRTGCSVTHFAYPFGLAAHAGEREFRLVEACGFDTATTTREGNLFPAHNEHLHCLPRIEVTGRHQDVAFVDICLSGLVSLWRYGPQRVVTA